MLLAVLTAEETTTGVIILATIFVLILMMSSIWYETKDGVTPYSTPFLGAIFWMFALSVVILACLGVSLLLT